MIDENKTHHGIWLGDELQDEEVVRMLDDLVGDGGPARPEVSIDAATLDAGLDKIGDWVDTDFHGVLSELLRDYVGGIDSYVHGDRLTSEESLLGPETSNPGEGVLLRFVLPWIVSTAVREAKEWESEHLADEAKAALREGNRVLATERWAESQNILSQSERWAETSVCAYERLRTFCEVAFVPHGSMSRN